MIGKRALAGGLTAGLLWALTAAADAPAPRPPAKGPLPEAAAVAPAPEPAPAPPAPTTSGRRPPPPAPALADFSKMDFGPAIEAARKAAAARGAGRAEKERLLALLLLAEKPEEARGLLAELAGKEASDAAKALAQAAARIEKDLKALPDRKKGQPCEHDEAALRLQLAEVRLAAGRVAEAHALLEDLGPCKEPGDELGRLALLGLAAWKTGARAEAVRLLDELARRAETAGALGVRALNLVTEIKGYGVYKTRPDSVFRVGQELAAYCEVLNFDCRRTESGDHLVALDVDAVLKKDAVGAENDVVWQCPGIFKVRHRTASEIRDLHLHVHFPIPAGLEPSAGPREAYRLQLIIRDPASGQRAESALLPIEVVK